MQPLPWKRIMASLLAAFSGSAFASDAEQAVTELRRFCLAEVCLGSSIEEARALGVMDALTTDRRKGACDEQDVVTTSLQLADGSRAQLTFRGYPLSGGLEARYRLAGIARRLAVNPSQLTYLSQRVTDRYAMKREDKDPTRWSSTTPLYEVYFQASFRPDTKAAPGQADVVLHAEHKQFMNWVFEQPECSAKLPRL